MIEKIDANGRMLTDEYWDCECQHDYIHPRKQKKCGACGARRDDQPDSHVQEVLLLGLPVDTTELVASGLPGYDEQQRIIKKTQGK